MRALQARGRFGVRLGLGRTRALLRRLGDPHLSVRGALIGGTNGKGSVQALVASVLREAGYTVGQTPKPHLQTYRERIVVDGEPISEADFAKVVGEVIEQADRLGGRYGAPTEFEVLTAAAFEWFARVGTDVAVVEVGLGGRLDATNVWQGGVSAITNVALDHMEYLGNTVEAIAKEKAAIIKRGDVAAVTGAEPPALSVIRRRAARVGVTLDVREPLKVVGVARSGTRAVTSDGVRHLIGLIGRHQAGNAAVALGILDGLQRAGFVVDHQAIDRGLARARWPGRMEIVSGRQSTDVLLDGAHNPAGMSALASTLTELLPQLSDKPVVILVAALANHWQAGMLEPLRASVPDATVIATTVPGATTSLEPRQLASAWGRGARAIGNTDDALEAAERAAASDQRVLVVCGSLYLVGHVRGILVGGPTD